MNTTDLHKIAKELNSRARTHAIGSLQEIRADLKHLTRQPSERIFSSQTTHDEWAFHHGGRSELQFNIGLENVSDVAELRYGVAFSFETSRTLPSIEILIPKVRVFNEFMRLYSELYEDMRMWHYQGARSSDYMPGPIPPELVTEGVFVFLGKRQPVDRIDYDQILNDFDRLLPLYKYVESSGRSQPVSLPAEAHFAFRPGCSTKASSATATQAQRQLDISLRHHELQEALYRRLLSVYGAQHVGTELPSGVGTSVDVVVRRNDGYWFYEIKTARSPRACLREALGQLLEYAFWPGAQEATRLIVVGDGALAGDAEEYLKRLKERFALPIEYEQIVPNGRARV
jgi:hypothetical protein